MVNQLPQDLLPQVDEEMTQEEVDKLLEAGVPKAWRTSSRENLNLVVQAKTPEELAEAKAKKGQGPQAAEEAPRGLPGQAPERGQVRPQEPEAAGPGAVDRQKQRSYNKRLEEEQGQVHGRPGRRHRSKDAQKLDAKSRADERKARDEKAKAERGQRRSPGRAVGEEEADEEPQAAGELGQAWAHRSYAPRERGS